MNNLVPPEQNPHFIEHPIAAAITSEIVGLNALTTYWRETIRAQRETGVFTFLGEVSQAIADLYEELAGQKAHLENKVDLGHIESAEFKRTLANVCEVVIREGDDVKKEYLKSFLVNYAREKRPDVTARQLYFSLLDRLTGSHIVLLKTLYDRQQKLSDHDLLALRNQPGRSEVLSLAAAQTELAMDVAILDLLKHTMEASGLITVLDSPDAGDDRSQRLLLRPVGKSLMRFLLGEWE
jgi:hypothetical protein